jgi:predicted RNA binding protein YcfA (HicA-like mRNA interferase family)
VSPKLPAVSARAIARVAEKAGFTLSRQRGSHAIYYRECDHAMIVIPVPGGRDVDPRVVAGIVDDMGLTPEEFQALL